MTGCGGCSLRSCGSCFPVAVVASSSACSTGCGGCGLGSCQTCSPVFYADQCSDIDAGTGDCVIGTAFDGFQGIDQYRYVPVKRACEQRGARAGNKIYASADADDEIVVRGTVEKKIRNIFPQDA